MLLRLRERFSCWAGFRVVLTRKGIDAMYKAYNKRRKKRTDISDDETEASADESRADPGKAEPEQTASAAEGTLGRGTRRAATSTDTMEDPSPDATQGRRVLRQSHSSPKHRMPHQQGSLRRCRASARCVPKGMDRAAAALPAFWPPNEAPRRCYSLGFQRGGLSSDS